MRLQLRPRLLVVVLALALQVALWAAPAQHVVIVSLDGGRPDVILTSNTPNIHALAAGGAYTWWAQTIFPSITLPSHTSMLTGCGPAKHKITWNDTFHPELGYVRVTTCFEIAKAAGFGTAMFVGKLKLKHIAKPGTVDEFEVIDGGAGPISRAAARYFVEHEPGLMFVHFPDPDGAGHSKGWGSPAQHASVEACDKGVGVLWEAIKASGVADKTVIIITADHGGHLLSHGSRDVRDMTIPWVCYGPGIIKPGEVQAPVFTCDTAATAVHALGLKVDPDWDGRPVDEVFVSEAQPVAVH